MAGVYLVSKGGYSTSLVDSRAVFSAALLAGAHNVILVHNHPSGGPSPSLDDRMIECARVRWSASRHARDGPRDYRIRSLRQFRRSRPSRATCDRWRPDRPGVPNDCRGGLGNRSGSYQDPGPRGHIDIAPRLPFRPPPFGIHLQSKRDHAPSESACSRVFVASDVRSVGPSRLCDAYTARAALLTPRSVGVVRGLRVLPHWHR